MNKENLDSLLTAIAGLAMAIVTIFWPTQKDTIQALIINGILPVLFLLVAILYPSGKAVGKVYAMRAAAAQARAGIVRRSYAADPSENVDAEMNELLNGIYKNLEADGIPIDVSAVDPVPVAPILAQWLGNVWNNANYSIAFKQVLLNKAVEVASASFTKVTNLPAPTLWKEVAAPQTYWKLHQVACAVHSEGLFHQVLMPLRTALKVKDTGAI